MNVVTGRGETVGQWLAQRYGVHVGQSSSEIVGLIDDAGVLRGAFVLTWRNDVTAELHVYGKSSNDVWKWLFRALFERCSRVEIRTRRDNRSIKRNAPKYGFKFEGVARSYYGPGKSNDALVYAMTADHCRWIGTHGVTVQVA